MQQQTPPGVSFEENPDGFVLASTLRSPDALFRVAVSCTFAALLLYAVFGCEACGFRNPRSTVVVILISAAIALNAVNWVFGRIVISRRGDQLEVMHSIGPWGRRRSVPWSDIVEIREEPGPRKRFGGRRKYISVIACPKLTSGVYSPARKVRFGSLLPDERREFILKILESRRPPEK